MVEESVVEESAVDTQDANLRINEEDQAPAKKPSKGHTKVGNNP
jgi:hypothetical protein